MPYNLHDALARITETTPDQLASLNAIIIDIREPNELGVGALPGAITIPMGQLQVRIDEVVANKNDAIVLYCAVGQRSAVAAADLEDAGYSNVSSLRGGIKLWMEQGRHTVTDSRLTEAETRRYARHIVLPQVGVSGQHKLLDSKVLIVGAGGLGSPAALYLAAAGIGTIGLVDDDNVNESNLQRQILHSSKSTGIPKTESGKERIEHLSPATQVNTHTERLTADNALDILGGYDVVIDGTDNFATRYLINDASMHLATTVVHGSIFRFEGQVAVFQPHVTACYRCVFPEPPPPELAPSCAEAGVLGVLPGVIGTMQATEALKLLLGIGEPLLGRLLTYDALDQSTHTVRLERRPECRSCGGSPPELVDDPLYC